MRRWALRRCAFLKCIGRYRTFPRAITCSDSLGPPAGQNITDDAVWAAVLAPSSGTTLTITAGGASTSFTVPQGINYFEGGFGAGVPSFRLANGSQTLLSGNGARAIQTSGCKLRIL